MHRYFVADAAEQVLPAVTHINLNVRIPGAGWVPAVAVQGVREATPSATSSTCPELHHPLLSVWAGVCLVSCRSSPDCRVGRGG